MPPKDEPIIPQQVRYFEEKLPVNQGKLTLGYRTNVSYGDEDYLAMLFYNGIWGLSPFQTFSKCQGKGEPCLLCFFTSGKA